MLQLSLLALECLSLLLIKLVVSKGEISKESLRRDNKIIALCLASLALILTIVAGILIWRWKKSELAPHGYRWNMKDEGLFVLFFSALFCFTIYSILVFTNKVITNWRSKGYMYL